MEHTRQRRCLSREGSGNTQGKGSVLPPSTRSSSSAGLRCWPAQAKASDDRHQSLAERQRGRKQRQCRCRPLTEVFTSDLLCSTTASKGTVLTVKGSEHTHKQNAVSHVLTSSSAATMSAMPYTMPFRSEARLTERAGWISMLLLEWLRNAVKPPGSRGLASPSPR